jgi:hypothetical protein
MALPIDFCAERSPARTFFSALFSMTDKSSRTSDSDFSILVNSETAFFDFFFDFMNTPVLQDRTE